MPKVPVPTYKLGDAVAGEVNKAVFEQLQLTFSTMCSEYAECLAIGENAKLITYRDAMGQLVFFAKSWVLDGHKIDRLVPEIVKYPATWWDHWKLEHGPEWVVKRWPVKFTVMKVTKELHQHYICPHINMRDGSNRHQHIVWMWEKSGQKYGNS